MTRARTETTERRLPPKTAAESETAWPNPPAESVPAAYTKAIFLHDLEMASRRITDDINGNPGEVAKLRRSIKQAEKGERRAYRSDDERSS